MIEDMLRLTVDVVFPKNSIKKFKKAKQFNGSPAKTSVKAPEENKVISDKGQTPEKLHERNSS